MMSLRHRVRLCLALLIGVGGAWLAAAPASSQGVPQPAGAPIRMLVGFGAGGGTDTVARIVAEPLSRKLNAPIVVENKPGAGGVLAMEELKRSRPDGQTLLMSSTGTLVMLPHIQRVPFDISKDITGIGTVVQYPLVIVVPASLGVKSLNEFIDRVKREPGKLSYASAGNGTGNHFAAEVLKKETGIDLVHVPYKSDGAAMPDLLAGRTAMDVLNIQIALPHIRSGSLVALAVTGPAQVPDLPGVPTVAQAGYPNVQQSPWSALIGPAGMAPEKVTQLNTALNEVLATPAVRKRFADLGQDVFASTPAQTREHIDRESARYRTVAAQAHIVSE